MDIFIIYESYIIYCKSVKKIFLVIRMNDRIEIAREFAKAINDEHIIRIILFGSVAREEDTEDSDIDILVLSNYAKLIEPKIREEVFKVVLDKKEFISAHVFSEEKLNKISGFSLMKNIEEEGIVLG